MLNLRRIAASVHLWNREMKIARMAPFSSPAENNGNRQINGDSSSADENAKSSIFEKLRSLTRETLDFIIREEEKKGVSVTQADLVSSAKQLHMEGKHENALQIFMWLDEKKMSFSTSELAVFVDVIAKTKGLDEAHAYLKKVDPDCDRMDQPNKNWPTYVDLLHLETELLEKRGLVRAVRRSRCRK
ncbi:unnamed protein product [Arabidopsis halleri]